MTAEERAEELAKALEADISDRRGLKWEWGKIDDDVRVTIRSDWAALLLTAIRAAEREALEMAANSVCRYAGRCNSDRCPCRAIRALIPERRGDEP